MNPLSGGRKPRKRWSTAERLWFVAAGLAGFLVAALVVFKL